MLGITDLFIQNSPHFVDIFTNTSLEDQDVLVSFNVISLFAQVPADIAIIIIRDRLHSDQDRTTIQRD